MFVDAMLSFFIFSYSRKTTSAARQLEQVKEGERVILEHWPPWPLSGEKGLQSARTTWGLHRLPPYGLAYNGVLSPNKRCAHPLMQDGEEVRQHTEPHSLISHFSNVRTTYQPTRSSGKNA